MKAKNAILLPARMLRKTICDFPKGLCAAAILLAIMGPHQARAKVLYSTSFPSPPFSSVTKLNAWAGIDGWTSNDTTSGAQGVFVDANGRRSGYLGFYTPDDNSTIVRRKFNYNPLAKGDSIIEISSTIEIVDSGNEKYDDFFIIIGNSGGKTLAGLFFDNSTLEILRANGPDLFNTGRTFVNNANLDLQISINFRTNQWSARLNGVVLFSNAEFNGDGQALDFGDIDYTWHVPNISSPGDDFLRVYDLTVTAPVDPARAAKLDSRIKKLEKQLAKSKRQLRKAKNANGGSKAGVRKISKKIRTLKTQIRATKRLY